VPGLEREEFRGATGGNDGGVRVTPGGFGLSGPHAGRGWEFSRASSALPRSKARFELLSRARLRAVFGGRWAVPSWPDPTYQTRKSAKIWGEMGNTLSAQPTKHAHNVLYLLTYGFDNSTSDKSVPQHDVYPLICYSTYLCWPGT
jgi:hypothetical protein